MKSCPVTRVIGDSRYWCQLPRGHEDAHLDGYGFWQSPVRPEEAEDDLPPFPGMSMEQSSANLVRFWTDMAMTTKDHLMAATYWDMAASYATKAADALRNMDEEEPLFRDHKEWNPVPGGRGQGGGRVG